MLHGYKSQRCLQSEALPEDFLLTGLPDLDLEIDLDLDLDLDLDRDLDLLLELERDLELALDRDLRYKKIISVEYFKLGSNLLDSESESTPLAFCSLFPFLFSTSLSSSSLE